MRKDMVKVTTERTRGGGHGKDSVYDKANRVRDKRTVFSHRKVNEDFSLKKESMRKRYHAGGNPKEFTDLLGPLEGYLLSKVGERWDDVWSDICKVFKGNGIQAHHIKSHVKQFVGGIPHSGETHFDDKDWYNGDGIYHYSPVYVDENGVVRKSYHRNKWWKKAPKKFRYYRESDTVEYHRLNGAWFKYESVWVSRRCPCYGGCDHKDLAYWDVSKRALSKRDIKRLDLNNRWETSPPSKGPDA